MVSRTSKIESFSKPRPHQTQIVEFASKKRFARFRGHSDEKLGDLKDLPLSNGSKTVKKGVKKGSFLMKTLENSILTRNLKSDPRMPKIESFSKLGPHRTQIPQNPPKKRFARFRGDSRKKIGELHTLYPAKKRVWSAPKGSFGHF